MKFLAIDLGGKASRAFRHKPLFFLICVVVIVTGYFAIKDLRSGYQPPGSLKKHVAQMEVEPGTQGMIAAMDEIEDLLDGSQIKNAYASMRQRLTLIRGIHNKHHANRHLKIAKRKLNAGDTEAALEILRKVASFSETANLGKEMLDELDAKTAIAFMRLGEQQNCVNNPHASSCIIPLNKEAVHQLRKGSTAAAEIYENKLLKNRPDDYTSKWLLNIAHMTLGQYPDGIPEKHVIPLPGLLDNYDGPKFSNISDLAGVDDVSRAGSVALEDFNNDGLMDIFVTGWGLDGRIKYYVRNADGTFRDSTKEAGLEGLHGGLNVIHGDYDNDGFSDIYHSRCMAEVAWPHSKFAAQKQWRRYIL